MNPKSVVEETVRHRQLWLVCALAALMIVAAVVIPNDAVFTRGIKIVLALVSIVSFALTMSLGYYFRDAWKKRPLSDRRAYYVWLTFETAIGISFALCILFFGCMCVRGVIFGG